MLLAGAAAAAAVVLLTVHFYNAVRTPDPDPDDDDVDGVQYQSSCTLFSLFVCLFVCSVFVFWSLWWCHRVNQANRHWTLWTFGFLFGLPGTSTTDSEVHHHHATTVVAVTTGHMARCIYKSYPDKAYW